MRRSLRGKDDEVDYWNFVRITAAQVEEWPEWMRGGRGRGISTAVGGGKSKSEMVIVLFCRKCQKETPHTHFGQRNNDPPRAIRSGIIVPGLEWDGSKCSDWFECQKCGEGIFKENLRRKTAAR